MRNKGWIFTRHGTTDIGLKQVNAKTAFNTYDSMVEKRANLVAHNDLGKIEVAAVAA